MVTKYLGLYIDESLTWVEHIKKTWDELTKVAGILYKVKNKFMYQVIKNFIHHTTITKPTQGSTTSAFRTDLKEPKTRNGTESIRYRATIVYNGTPMIVRTSKSMITFKQNLIQ